MLTPSVKSIGLSVGCNVFRRACASLPFDEGRNVKRLSERLGHADPGFTLRTDGHLMDAGVGGADFMDVQVDGSRAGRALQTAANPAAAEMAKFA